MGKKSTNVNAFDLDANFSNADSSLVDTQKCEINCEWDALIRGHAFTELRAKAENASIQILCLQCDGVSSIGS